MHPDKRRRGRRIRKTRRTFGKLATSFGELGRAATFAAASISGLGNAIREMAQREEEAARARLLQSEDAS